MKEAFRRLKIGVSGIRGVVGESLSPVLASDFAAAFGEFVGGGRVLIGRDTRSSGEMYENAVAAGLLSVGVQPVLRAAPQGAQAAGAALFFGHACGAAEFLDAAAQVGTVHDPPAAADEQRPAAGVLFFHVRQQFALQAVGQAEGKGLPAAGKFPAARPHDGGGDLPQALQRQAGKGEQLDQQV